LNKNVLLKEFVCKNCEFSTRQKSDYLRHISTLKHQHCNKKSENNFLSKIICLNCKQQYLSSSGLWKHMKTCKPEKTVNLNIKFDTSSNENQELKLLLKNKITVDFLNETS